MKDYTPSFYRFRNHKVRVYCKPNGKHGRVVVEDILKVLYSLNWESLLEEKLSLVRDNLTTVLVEDEGQRRELHLAGSDDAMDFWKYCDDAESNETEDQTLYKDFGYWLEYKVCKPIEEGQAHMADAFSRLESISRFSTKTIEEGNSEKIIQANEWIRIQYNIEIDWLRTQIVSMFKTDLSSAYLLFGEERASKSNGRNIYPYKFFGAIEPDITELLSGKNLERIEEFKRMLKDSMNAPQNFNKGNDILKDAEEVRQLLVAKRSDNEIIERIWGTPLSSFPNQYLPLKWFLDVVKGYRR